MAEQPFSAKTKTRNHDNVEAHISAQQSQAIDEARLSGPQVDSRWPRRAAVASPEGSPQAECLRAVPPTLTPDNPPQPTTRSIVAALRGPDRVAVGRRSSPLRLTYVSSHRGIAIRDHRLVFAIGRHVGNAVCRNRCRRRVRAAFREVATTRRVPEGAFLIRPTSAIAELPYRTVTAELLQLLDQLDSRLAPSGSS